MTGVSGIPGASDSSSRNIYFGSLENELEFEGISSNLKEDVKDLKGDDAVSSPFVRNSNSHGEDNEEFKRRALARTLRIPTEDHSVKQVLISLNQPIILFGEGPAERRDRLKLMASRAIQSLPRAFELFPVLKGLTGEADNGDKSKLDANCNSDDEEDEEFYVPGSVDLVNYRRFILEDSIERSIKRNQSKTNNRLNLSEEQKRRADLYASIKKDLDLRGSRMEPLGRPISICRFNPIQKDSLITADWSGKIITYSQDLKGVEGSCVIEGNQRITAMDISNCGEMIIGTADGRILTMNTQVNNGANVNADSAINSCVKSLDWHPSGSLFASSSSDSLWRLWDASRFQVIQVQEGHRRGIDSATWHPDGGIYCTADGDGIRIWDCRLGKSIWHIPTNTVNSVDTVDAVNTNTTTALTFSPMFPHLLSSATSAGLIIQHDLRKLSKAVIKTAAHRSVCTALRFANEGRTLLSAGFDGHVRVWCPGDLRLITELAVTANKITDMDAVSGNDDGGLKIAAVTFDRNVKLYSTN